MAVAKLHPATGIDHAAESAKHLALAREHGRARPLYVGNLNLAEFHGSLSEFHGQMAKRRAGYVVRAGRFLAVARRRMPFDRGEFGSGELALERAARHHKKAVAYERKKAATPARVAAKARPRRAR